MARSRWIRTTWMPPEYKQTSDDVFFDVRQSYPKWVGSVGAGGELDPAYLTAAGLRAAANEWPDILRAMADEIDRLNSDTS